MDPKTRVAIPVINITSPCSESWDAMSGDQRSRFCEKCQHDVISSEGVSNFELDLLARSGRRVCMRLTVDRVRGVLTRDGWVPRLVTAGAAAVALTGCSKEIVGEAAPTRAQVEARDEAYRAMQDKIDNALIALHLKEEPQMIAGMISPRSMSSYKAVP